MTNGDAANRLARRHHASEVRDLRRTTGAACIATVAALGVTAAFGIGLVWVIPPAGYLGLCIAALAGLRRGGRAGRFLTDPQDVRTIRTTLARERR